MCFGALRSLLLVFSRSLLTPSLPSFSHNSEIAARQFNTADSKGPRSFSKFLVRLAEISPRLLLKQIALLQKHLDSEVSRFSSLALPMSPLLTLLPTSPPAHHPRRPQSYPMRNAILEVIGLLIRELSITEGLDLEPEKQKRQLEAFFDLLFERFLDLNSFVRSKVAGVLLKTCE